MPLLIIPALYTILRYLLMALLTGIAVDLALSILNKATDVAIEWLKEEFDLTDDDALIIIANHIVDILITTGTIYGLIKLKIPTKFAQRLGLTSGKYAKKAMSADGIKKMAGKVITEEAKGTLKKKMITAFGISFATSLPWLPSLIENTTEVFVYAGRDLNHLLDKIHAPSFLRIPVRPTTQRIIPFTKESWPQYLNGLKTQNIAGLNDTFTQQTKIFSEDALIEIVESLYGQEVVAGRKPTEKQMILLLAPFLIGSSGTVLFRPEQTSLIKPFIQQVKVFTGIVSQGTLGAGLSFTPRPDDIIDSLADLQFAAQNNLAPFLVALPSKIVYEVKIVSSVTSTAGFRQSGAAQRIISSYATDGTPRYKTIINKFATLTLFVLTDKMTRTKISTIVLGPTDALKFQPTTDNLRTLEKDIQASVTTSDVRDIATLQTSNPITVQAPPPPPPAIPTPEPPAPAAAAQTPPAPPPPPVSNIVALKATLDAENLRYRTIGDHYQEMVAAQKAYDKAVAPPTPVSVALTAQQLQDIAKQKAATLSEFYSAIGQPLPSMQTRAAFYQMLGLGQASYYTGTAEQNTKLLAKLQGK